MQDYRPRKIEFQELIEINNWQIKIYTISKIGRFDYPIFYQNVLGQLHNWLKLENSFDSSHDKVAFLILHAGTEGIFSLINWWVGKNMLNTNIFLTNPEMPHRFKKISGDGLAPCIWELEIINHERISWTSNILKEHKPNYEKYLNDTIDIEI